MVSFVRAVDVTDRHVGDLGNIKASASGSVITTFKDGLVSLEGVNNVSGRTVVVSSPHTLAH